MLCCTYSLFCYVCCVVELCSILVLLVANDIFVIPALIPSVFCEETHKVQSKLSNSLGQSCEYQYISYCDQIHLMTYHTGD